jgi:hypothetical protein
MTWKTSIGTGAIVVAMAVVLLIAAGPAPARSAPAPGSGTGTGWSGSMMMPGTMGAIGEDHSMDLDGAGMIGSGMPDMSRHEADMGGDTMTEMMGAAKHRAMTDGQACPDGYEDMGGPMGQAVPGMGVASMTSGRPGPDGR